MKTIIAGSRFGVTLEDVQQAIKLSGFTITEVVSGCAKGADMFGEQWADAHRIPVETFPALWQDLSAKPCAVRSRPDGTRYNSLAGHNRNEEMAKYADALIAVWNGKSTGTMDMVRRAQAHGLKVFLWEKGKV